MAWNQVQVSELLSDTDAIIVENMQLCRSGCRDRLIWNETLMGNFTVRSAYFVAKRVLNGWNQFVDQRSCKWRLLWTSKVIPKVKVFMWRAIHEILPTSEKLQHRGIPIEVSCAVCGCLEESWRHSLFECVFSKQVWTEAGVQVNDSFLEQLQDGCFWENFFESMHRENKLEVCFYLLWSIWGNRNKCLHEGTCQLPKNLWELAICKQLEFMGVAGTESNAVVSSTTEGWRPPAQGGLKINVDASFSGVVAEAGVGLVARDSTGTVVFSAYTRFNSVRSSLMAEVLAIWWALEIAREQHFNRIVVESDCLLAVNEINNKGRRTLWEGGNVIYNIVDLALEFSICTFSHTRRNSNKLAHVLAKCATQVDCVNFFWRSLPSNICNPDLLHY
ncbi:hypothetical protein REPUB_Repub11eG0112000 [Reevesia pubescens]